MTERLPVLMAGIFTKKNKKIENTKQGEKQTIIKL